MKHITLAGLLLCLTAVPSFAVNVNPIADATFDAASKTKLDEAVSILQKVINSEEFAARVRATKFKIGNHGMNSEQILQLILSGADNYTGKPSDGSIDLRVSVYDAFKGGKEFGNTDMITRVTTTHRCYILNNNVMCYVSHLAHEYMHQIGFYDKHVLGIGKKTSSVPYKIGNIIDGLIGNPQNCLAQIGQTCTP